jgi:hypothetical protein
MTIDLLQLQIELLSEEYDLVQAWKKTASYIRSNNWYSDTLALDRAAINLPQFLEEVAVHLKSFKDWKSDPLRVMPALKGMQC